MAGSDNLTLWEKDTKTGPQFHPWGIKILSAQKLLHSALHVAGFFALSHISEDAPKPLAGFPDFSAESSCLGIFNTKPINSSVLKANEGGYAIFHPLKQNNQQQSRPAKARAPPSSARQGKKIKDLYQSFCSCCKAERAQPIFLLMTIPSLSFKTQPHSLCAISRPHT